MELRTPDPEPQRIPDRDGLPSLPASFVAPRLRTLRARCEGVRDVHFPARGWIYASVVQEGGLPRWTACLMSKCGADCVQQAGCVGGDHEPLVAVQGPSSLSTYRRFRSKARALLGIVEVPHGRPFVRGAEDRA